MRRILYAAFMLVFLLPANAYSQLYNDFGFERNSQVVVTGLKYPWAGGLNSCQFSLIDMNLDGLKDLFVYDRHSNKILTYINNGSGTVDQWVLSDGYAGKFPAIQDWVRLVDYNNDGKEDIFTYMAGGIVVYKNISNSVTGLKFILITNQLLSFHYTSYQNIYVSSVDYPSFCDIDNDGDLDILTFWILGNYVNYHRNMSMENYGNCDSLNYRLEQNCWGYIMESNSLFRIFLNVPCPYDCGKPFDTDDYLMRGDRHTGSTLLNLDLNNDNLKDLILGDIDNPNLIALRNGGTVDTARMISQDTTYPSQNIPVHLNSFVDCDYLDLTGDGIKDLVVSPFDPNVLTPENDNSVWLYRNNGQNNAPQFQYVATDFLQGDMIDAGTSSYPVLEDIDGDGLKDLIVGSYGYYDSSWMYQGSLKSSFTSRLFYYRNTGTQAVPAFTLSDTNFAGIYSLHLSGAVPTFGDPDNDSDRDLMLGSSDGRLIFLENIAGPGNFPVYAQPVYSYNGIDVGDYSAPQWIDLDNDGTIDIISGNKKGLIRWYRNTGSGFVLENDSLGMVDVKDPAIGNDAMSIPLFVRGYDNKLKLFVGSKRGGVAFYNNIEANLYGWFTLINKNYLSLRDSYNSAFTVAKLDGDSLFDMISGTTSGGLLYYKGTLPDPIGVDDYSTLNEPILKIFPNPASEFVDLYLESNVSTEYNGIIADLTGRTLNNFLLNSNDHIRLDVSKYANGIYVLKLWHNSAKGKTAGLVKRIILCK